MNKPLLAILGPTASGKSNLALQLAKRFEGEIVSCDSVQVYRYLDIGTSKIPPQEQAGIRHHLMDFLSPDQEFTAGQYMSEGRKVLADIKRRGHLPLVVGGTGLYFHALLNGLFHGPSRSNALRKRFYQQAEHKGVTHLHRLLQRVDPVSARRISPRDQPKIIRALEVFFLTSKPLSVHFRVPPKGLQGFQLLRVALNQPRPLLCERINKRVDRMFSGGLIEEVQSILDKGILPTCKPLKSLGYAQSIGYLQGSISLPTAVASTKQATRQYAKRQMTWFRKEPEILWFHGFGDEKKVALEIEANVARFIHHCSTQQPSERDPSHTQVSSSFPERSSVDCH